MIPRKNWLLLLVLLAGAVGVRVNATQPQPAQTPAGVRVVRNLEYARPHGKAMLLDLYLPEKAEAPLPLIVWIHGGGWSAGNKERPPGMHLVRSKGYALASISYRLSHVDTFPAQIEDCKAAIRFLRANADEYRIDPKKIGVWGASAGGHLVALIGLTAGKFEGDAGSLGDPVRVQAVIDWFGPTDLLKLNTPAASIDHDAPNAPGSLLIGGPLQENREKALKASPISYVSKDAAPILMMHGDQDKLVHLNQSEMLLEALDKAGAEATLVKVKGAGHGLGGPRIDAIVEAFFDRHLKGQGDAWQKAAPGSGRIRKVEVELKL